VLSGYELLYVALIITGLVAAHWVMRARTLEAVVAHTPPLLVSLVWSLMAFAVVISQGNGNAFIYFQF
jgi:alginate O-acetyltransferase complex protein AlgI